MTLKHIMVTQSLRDCVHGEEVSKPQNNESHTTCIIRSALFRPNLALFLERLLRHADRGRVLRRAAGASGRPDGRAKCFVMYGWVVLGPGIDTASIQATPYSRLREQATPSANQQRAPASWTVLRSKPWRVQLVHAGKSKLWHFLANS